MSEPLYQIPFMQELPPPVRERIFFLSCMKISQSDSKRIATERKSKRANNAKTNYLANPFIKIVVYAMLIVLSVIFVMIKSGFRHEFWQRVLGK